MDKYGMHLLVLSHVYRVAGMKRASERGLARLLTADNVVDLLELAGECDAPWLAIQCMKVVAKEWPAVKKSEAWKFVQTHDPWLELRVLQLLEDFESVHFFYFYAFFPFYDMGAVYDMNYFTSFI